MILVIFIIRRTSEIHWNAFFASPLTDPAAASFESTGSVLDNRTFIAKERPIDLAAIQVKSAIYWQNDHI